MNEDAVDVFKRERKQVPQQIFHTYSVSQSLCGRMSLL
eukprot:CAMPEP_0194710060 /NCGR_PEP_ID=MMETSP0296-20130528/2703_1 /TAXON_ID=39354 /ORGANISM="Heterosigma akashiwo, Strain CCMP2393" /LENGTH=37 /DNA_ID= /DNA_START= /DNA_END= /DNA_ORIENTATION=